MTDSDRLQTRFEDMLKRIDEAYDGMGHSSGRPYLYFVYGAEREQIIRRMVREQMSAESGTLRFLHLDLLTVTLESLQNQEEKRTALLNDEAKGESAAKSVMRLWARRLRTQMETQIADVDASLRPVVVLQGMAALHPIGNPTMLMEAVAEEEPRNPHTGQIVPVVLLVPGERPPQTSREYLFLGREDQRLTFYRGEEI